MKKDVKAIFFDVDGTILDTREFIFQAAEHALAVNGYPPVPRERIARAVGGSFEAFYGFLLERNDIDVLALQTAHRMFQLENIGLSAPFPGSKETLLELKRRGYTLAAITNRGRHSVTLSFDHVGFSNMFDLVLCSDDVPELKPSPVPVQMALKHFGLTESEAVMVGDTDMDIESGKRAGVKTVRVWYGFMGKHTENVLADHYVENSISEVLELFP